MAARKAILIVGWEENPPEASAQQVADAGTKEELMEKVKYGMKKSAEAGYDVTPCLLQFRDLKGSEAKLREALSSKKWDGYLIGNGVRGIAEYTEFFEVAVNLGRELQPNTRIGFNTTPLDTYDAIIRNF